MSKRDKYQIRTATSRRKAERLMREGWELLDKSGGFFMTATVWTLRRPNPRYRGE